MTIAISISCDGLGCDEGGETSTSIDAGVNEIEGVLDTGWEHGPDGDFCPRCKVST